MEYTRGLTTPVALLGHLSKQVSSPANALSEHCDWRFDVEFKIEDWIILDNRWARVSIIQDRQTVIRTAEELLDCLDFSAKFVYEKIAACRAPEPKFTCSIEARHNTY